MGYKQLIFDVKLNTENQEQFIETLVKFITEQGHEVMTPNDLIISHDVEDFYRIDNPIKTNI
jgi:hypothetical protein